MRIGDICTLHTIHCQRDTSVQDAALLMRQHHVGDLIVAEQPNGERVPIGILTDRDIVISVIALGLDPASLLVGDIMSAQLLTASEDEDVYDIIERMRVNGIRRLPVVNSLGIDPIHFGVVCTVATVIGLVTPPVGPGLYIAMVQAQIRMGPLFKATVPFLAAVLAVLVLVAAVPELSTWLPSVTTSK